MAVAGFNLGLLMRTLMGYGTPKELAIGLGVAFLRFCDGTICIFCFTVAPHGENNRKNVHVYAVVTWRTCA